MTAELTDDITEFVRLRVALGKSPFDEIVEETVDYLTDEESPDVVGPLAREITARELAAHVTAQESWPAVTDSDRVTRAFTSLETAGLVARQAFTCCQSCGVAEISAEIPRGETRDGYVFFHQQDAERAAEGGSLFLSYGALAEALTDEQIAHRVVAELSAQGLTPEWSGDVRQRITVPMTWQRRRTGPLAEVPPP